MVVRFLFVGAALALATTVQAQTLPASPALPDNLLPDNPGIGAPVAPGPARRGVRHHQPTPQNLQQNDPATRRLQNETDELYQEIMRRSAPPAAAR